MPSGESGVSKQDSEAATSPSTNANASERAGSAQSQCVLSAMILTDLSLLRLLSALFDSRNVLITGGQFHNTLGHHTSFVVHINREHWNFPHSDSSCRSH